jgi:hypothetical protein
VVDDEAEIREMLREFLSRQGLAVSVADGGAAMREVMADRPVDPHHPSRLAPRGAVGDSGRLRRCGTR